jgi:hypothetical protein
MTRFVDKIVSNAQCPLEDPEINEQNINREISGSRGGEYEV